MSSRVLNCVRYELLGGLWEVCELETRLWQAALCVSCSSTWELLIEAVEASVPEQGAPA